MKTERDEVSETIRRNVGLQLNKELAKLLGWTHVFDTGGALLGRPPGGAPDSRGQALVPNWSGDISAATKLGLRYHLHVDHQWIVAQQHAAKTAGYELTEEQAYCYALSYRVMTHIRDQVSKEPLAEDSALKYSICA